MPTSSVLWETNLFNGNQLSNVPRRTDTNISVHKKPQGFFLLLEFIKKLLCESIFYNSSEWVTGFVKRKSKIHYAVAAIGLF